MAHPVRGPLSAAVVALVGSLLLAQESGQRFSHSVHIKTVGLSCVQCHTAVDESRSARDINLPTAETCGVCHSAEAGDLRGRASDFSAEVPPRPLLFSHKQHLGISDLVPQIVKALESGSYPEGDPAAIRRQIDSEEVCTACHRGLQETDLGRREHYPLMSDCLACHKPKGNAMAECRTCHVPDFDLLPADHRVTTFFDQHSAEDQGKNLNRCRQCHTPRFNPCSQCH
ncbi:MAG: hypothetical protein EHM18_15540 [Acidobacteria bacterium]|nr:MAG: hypothetical protein EHM18_15540 [Acidobacteriota bacterium]